MRQTRVMLAGVVATVAIAACSQSGSAPIDLGHELETATGDTSGLLPTRGGTQFVSAIERTPGSVPATTPVKRPTPTPRAVPQPVKAPVQTKQSEPEAQAVAAAPAAPAPAAAPAETPAPTPTPTPTPHRRGGYSSMGDIMRNAPFPINPETSRSAD